MIEDELEPCPNTPNCVSSQATDEDHFISPLQFAGSSETAKARLLRVLKSEKRVEITAVEENYVRVEFRSLFFRFVDDVEFLILEKQGDGSVIHVRSASRVGRSDFGVNRRRVERIRSKF